MSINFTARLVGSPTIKHRPSLFSKSKDMDVSVVELDNKDSCDMVALNRVATDWGDHSGQYAGEIFFLATNGEPNQCVGEHFYALTTQKDNFKNLKSDNILGLMMFKEGRKFKNEIMLLEVNPKTSYSKNFFRKYKDVGRRLVEHVQSEFDDKKMVVLADYSARKFYKKLGFEEIDKRQPCKLCWEA